jgi:thymidine phosphorylase
MADAPPDLRAILSRLRHGTAPDADALAALARGLADGTVGDAQAGALAMGLCHVGLDDAGTVALTRAMRDSGRVLRWDLPGPVLDKHSTGGVGDATSLIVAPVLAALGAYAPMLSGRGLGHTGGTLDKLESIPGVETVVTEARLRAIVRDTGCAIVGASAEIAPADRRLYAIRDVTGTVDSVPLITASILSKKLAGGADALVLDVKGGSGAFMRTRKDAEGLAQRLVVTAQGAGMACRAIITDMNQPLADAVGNALEVAAVLDVLRRPRPDDRLCALSLALAGEALALGGLADTAAEGARAALAALADGRAADRFGAMVAALGGPADLVDAPARHLPRAPVVVPVPAARAGHVAGIDGAGLGDIVVRLGGGRRQAGDAIDPRVGLSRVVRLGAQVAAGDPLAMVHAATEADAQAALPALRAAILLGDAPATVPPLVHGRVG